MMTYGGKKHKKDTKDQSLDDSKHTEGKSERRLGLVGKTLNLVCPILSFRCFGNDQRGVWAQIEERMELKAWMESQLNIMNKQQKPWD